MKIGKNYVETSFSYTVYENFIYQRSQGMVLG